VSTKILTRGRAAHSSVPEQGINAVERMARIIHAFEDYNGELLISLKPNSGRPRIVRSAHLVPGEEIQNSMKIDPCRIDKKSRKPCVSRSISTKPS
jgi:acetylornithine deacetylase/succinyl-diaminopimelate desuccinylase-like protein